MSLTYSFQTASDLYAKLKRDANALLGEVSGDHAFNFFVTAYHLAEWIQKDPSVHSDVKDRMTTASQSVPYRLCKDLANASKHFVQRGKHEAKRTDVAQGYGAGRYGVGAYGIGEESIAITRKDGSQRTILEFREQIMQLYSVVFDG